MARILVVDDEPSVCELIKDVLGSQGHTVEMAGDGSAALERLRNDHAYQLLIIDRAMPRMTGIQALTMIRSNPKYAKLPVIMCTSASVTKEIDEAFAAGANDYVLKPINLQALIAKVDKALRAG